MYTDLQSKKSYNTRSDIKEKEREGRKCYFLSFSVKFYRVIVFLYFHITILCLFL